MSAIKFKTIGYIYLELVETRTKGGKVKKAVKVLSNHIYKTKKTMQIAKERFIAKKINKVAGIASQIDILRNKVLRLSQKAKKGNWFGLLSKSVLYFRVYCAKLALYARIASISKSMRRQVNGLMDSLKYYNFNLNALNL